VICRKDRKNPKYTQDGNRELITVLECVSAEGIVLPPLVVTKRANYYIGVKKVLNGFIHILLVVG
jgi:hypothetical protein